jgi:hypothetical protein
VHRIVTTAIARCFIAASAFAAMACVPSGPPGGRMARFSPTDRDPVGFLLLNRDSLALPDSTVQQLVSLNLRLFRRNQPLQNQIDSMMRDVKFSRRREPGDSSAIPAEVRDAARPVAQQIRAQTAAVKDTAWSWLTPMQKERADTLEARQVARMNRGQPANVGPATRRP